MRHANPTLQELVDRDADFAAQIVSHPAQIAHANLIQKLLNEFDQAKSLLDVHRYQEHLIDETLKVSQARANIRRNALRTTERKLPVPVEDWPLLCAPSARSADEWEIERLVVDRAVRQLQAVGDALAWRTLAYTRPAIIALSANQSPGGMTNKAGLSAEREYVSKAWTNDKVFVLLHDLTSVLRIGDVTACLPDGSRKVEEIKSSGSASKTAQLRRVAQAVQSMFGNAPLASPSKTPTYLFSSPVQIKTDVSKIGDLTAIAITRNGGASGSIGQGRTLRVMDFPSAVEAGEFANLAALWQKDYERVLRVAAPGETTNLSLSSADFAGRAPSLAPFGIYPLPVDLRAKLICDLTVFTTSISINRLIEILANEGLTSKVVLDQRKGRGQLDPVLRVGRAERSFLVTWGSLGEIFLELVHPKRFAASAAHLVANGRPGVALMPTYSGESRVWL